MIAERIALLALFLVGLYGLLVRKNLVKKIFGLSIVNSAVVLLFILEGARIGDSAPIMEEGVVGIVDPMPQALMLTAIVIGLCLNALALALAVRLHRMTGSLDLDEIRRRIDRDGE